MLVDFKIFGAIIEPVNFLYKSKVPVKDAFTRIFDKIADIASTAFHFIKGLFSKRTSATMWGNSCYSAKRYQSTAIYSTKNGIGIDETKQISFVDTDVNALPKRIVSDNVPVITNSWLGSILLTKENKAIQTLFGERSNL